MFARFGEVEHLVQDVALTLVCHPGQRGDAADESGKTCHQIGRQFGSVFDEIFQDEIA